MSKKRVAVIFGGRSGEHRVSLFSAASIMEALDREKYEVIPVAITQEGRWFLGLEPQKLLAGEPPEAAGRHVVPVADPSQYGVVEVSRGSRIVSFTEKPPPGAAPSNLINAGIYVLDPVVLRLVPPQAFYQFEQGVFPALLRAGAKLYGFSWSGYWIDIGTPEKYRRLNFDLLAGKVRSPLLGPVEGTPCYLGEGCVVDGARWVGPVVMGDRCQVGGGAEVGESGEEGLAAFRGVGEAVADGLGGAGDQGQVGLADVNTCAEHGLSP